MAYQRKDAFYKKAKREGERSRAAYKLEELDNRFRLFKKGFRVVDAGAFPGGWSQVAGRAVGPQGKVVGVDLVPIEPVPEKNVIFLEGDVTDPVLQEKVLAELGGPPDVVVSDASPKLSGVRDADAARIVDLVEQILSFTEAVLRPGGSFVAKVFSRATPHEIMARCKKNFAKVKLTKPEASRKESSEIYLVAQGFKGQRDAS